MDIVRGAFDWIFEKLSNVLYLVVELLPASPFVFLDNIDEDVKAVLSSLNWFIPFHVFLTVLETWLVAVATYYVYKAILRWVKAID